MPTWVATTTDKRKNKTAISWCVPFFEAAKVIFLNEPQPISSQQSAFWQLYPACSQLSRQLQATLRQARDSVDDSKQPRSKPTIQSATPSDPATSPRPGRQLKSTPQQAHDSVDSSKQPRGKLATRSTTPSNPAASPRPGRQCPATPIRVGNPISKKSDFNKTLFLWNYCSDECTTNTLLPSHSPFLWAIAYTLPPVWHTLAAVVQT